MRGAAWAASDAYHSGAQSGKPAGPWDDLPDRARTGAAFAVGCIFFATVGFSSVCQRLIEFTNSASIFMSPTHIHDEAAEPLAAATAVWGCRHSGISRVRGQAHAGWAPGCGAYGCNARRARGGHARADGGLRPVTSRGASSRSGLRSAQRARWRSAVSVSPAPARDQRIGFPG